MKENYGNSFNSSKVDTDFGRVPIWIMVDEFLPVGGYIAVSETYPDLKANQNFLELQAQLEGTENRITVARKEFNDATQAYNTAVRSFPANLIAMMFDFEQKPYFEADESTAAAPKVEF